ncbi:hypothetical protein SAMN05428938_7003 [Streptomyces sp. KS_5]|nr:hypothetical protein SAMN05428938_7003 [Streptomyces sp. KS_5]
MEQLPQELGFGSGMTCRRRDDRELRRLLRHEALLARLRSADALGFSRAAVDGSHVRASDAVGQCRIRQRSPW